MPASTSNQLVALPYVAGKSGTSIQSSVFSLQHFVCFVVPIVNQQSTIQRLDNKDNQMDIMIVVDAITV